ncbi:MAG: CBS domain-containing protein [Mesorhizobium sp.]|nr:MAG: CBS domain-containing protein [Mesorhizobium sp.]
MAAGSPCGNLRNGELLLISVSPEGCTSEDIEHVAQNMGDIQVRRLPVLNRDKRLVGVVTLADAALKEDPATAGIAMSGVVVPGGAHAT